MLLLLLLLLLKAILVGEFDISLGRELTNGQNGAATTDLQQGQESGRSLKIHKRVRLWLGINKSNPNGYVAVR